MPKAKNKRPISVAVTPSDGRWVSFYQVGTKSNGQPDRRKRSSTMCAKCRIEPKPGSWTSGKYVDGCDCYERCADKIRELEDKAAADAVEKPGQSPKVKDWFRTWLWDIAPVMPSASKREPLRALTLRSYRSIYRTWVVPYLGDIRIDVLEDDDLNHLYATMYRLGRQASTVAGAHSMIRRGLQVAVRRKKIGKNVARDMDPPGSPPKKKKKALAEKQVQKMFDVLEGARDELRWKVGFAIGPRQGEVLAIRWQYLNLDTGVVDTSWQIQRLTWQHGCADPHACGATSRKERTQGYHRTRPVCPGGAVHARYHRKGCPKGPFKNVCPPDCVAHADKCPKRRDGGIVFSRAKTFRDDDDQHLVALPRNLLPGLRDLHREQAALKLRLGSKYHNHDLVFCQADGKPLEPRKDYDRWKRLLKLSGLVGAGTHVQRSTAATLLFDRGERLEVVQEVLGHKNANTTRGYTEVDVGLTVLAAEAMDDLFAPRTATDLATEREKRRGDAAS